MSITTGTRIAHITDIHLTAESGSSLYGVDTAVSLQQVLDSIAALSPSPELIIASGDLVEADHAQSYLRLRQLLEKAAIPVYVLPGNHDHTGEMRNTLAVGNIHFVSHATHNDWAFVFVDSQVVGQDHGEVSQSELEQLRINIENLKGTPCLIALHHTPTPQCPSSGCQLNNAGELIELLAGYENVRCIISGHTHKAVEQNAGNMLQLTTPSTFAHVTHAQSGENVDHEDFWASHKLDGNRHGFRTLDLHSDGTIESKVHWTFS